jgi:hypothetical protein
MTVQLVEDVLAHGTADAPSHPQAPSADYATLVIHNNEGFPGVVLADGSVVVLTWRQMRALHEVFGQWAAIQVEDTAP